MTARSGMTLIEILIAMGIFSVGILGILAVFPVAINNIAIAVNRTLGGAVAKNAIASIQTCAIDLSIVGGQYATILGGTSSEIPLDGQPGVVFGDAVQAYHEDSSDGRYLGIGFYGQDSFKIPDDVGLDDVPELQGADVNGDGHPDYVAVPWHGQLGWTATLRPTPRDDTDGDGLFDEDPKGPGHVGVNDDAVTGDILIDEDEPDIDANTVYQLQVAVWRDYALKPSGGAQGKFYDDAAVVDITEGGAGDPDFWRRVKPGDYIRHRGHGVWCQIAQVLEGEGPDDGQIFLTAAFSHPIARTDNKLVGDIELASRFRLVTLYNTTVGP